MELLDRNAQQVTVRRAQEKDVENIYRFHKKKFFTEMPDYLINSLENFSGISLVAYNNDVLIGHILIIPLSSQQFLFVEEAALICGVWTNTEDTTELLIREAMMCAWETGYHVIFSFNSFQGLKKAGFVPIKEGAFFALNIKNCQVFGAELSWNGFEIINKDLVMPKVYLPTEIVATQVSHN